MTLTTVRVAEGSSDDTIFLLVCVCVKKRKHRGRDRDKEKENKGEKGREEGRQREYFSVCNCQTRDSINFEWSSSG